MPIYKQNGAYFRVFQDSRQGGRKYMEDVPTMSNHISENGQNDFLYFAVFDGHGGAEAARFAREHLLDEIKQIRGFWTQDKEQIAKAVKEAFVTTHKLMWKNVGKWPKTVTGLPSTAGTTASVVVIKAGYMFIAHVGDSSVVLGEENYWRTLQANCVTVDHKPESPAELKRIEESGGQVMSKSGVQRVVWNRPKPAHKGPIRRSTHIDYIPFLAVARALGDLWSYNSERDTFVVSPDPDLTVYRFDPKKHKYIIIASDGLWNMVKPEESVGYVEQLVEEGGDFTPSHNPARNLVQLALNKWAFRNMRADNTTVIVAMVEPPSGDDDTDLSRSNSRASSASTIRLSTETDTDILSDQEIDISANVEVNADTPSRNALPPIRPSPHHIGFFRHHPKHINSFDNGSRTPIRGHPYHRPATPGSAPNRKFVEKHNRAYAYKSHKHRRHSFWGNNVVTRPGDKVIVPTKYQSPEQQAMILAQRAAAVTPKQPPAKPGRSRKSKLLTPTKYRSPESKPAVSIPKPPEFSEDSKQCRDATENGQRASGSKDEAPGNISKTVPLEHELPLLNKIMVPTKYKMSTASVPVKVSPGNSHQVSGSADIGGALISKISPLHACSSKPSPSNKRKASLDCSGISAKKTKRSKSEPTSADSTPELSRSTSNDSGFMDSSAVGKSISPLVAGKSTSPLVATSAKSPLKVNTCLQPSPPTGVISPLWPSCLDKDIDLDVNTDTDQATYPLAASQLCRSVLHENPVLQNSAAAPRPCTVLGTQNKFARSASTRKPKSQGARMTVRNLRFRSKRPTKLRNSHRTRLQVKGVISRKS